MSVDVVTAKLPVFWSTSPSAWFVQAEAQFAIRSITQDYMPYYHVVSAFDSATSTRALYRPTPANTKQLKLYVYELSNNERASSLCEQTGFGDSKPSKLMDSMLSLLGDHNPCFLFEHLFLQQLPDFVRGSLANSVVYGYRSFAQEADKIYHAGRTQGQPLHEVSIKQYSIAQSKVIDNMFWYHHHFGTNARRCLTGCKHHAIFKHNQGNGHACHR